MNRPQASQEASKSALDRSATTAWLRVQVAQAAEIDPDAVDSEATFESLGLDSVDHFTIAGELAEHLGLAIPSSLLFDHKTITKTVAALDTLSATGLDCLTDLRGDSSSASTVYLVHSIAGDLGDLTEFAGFIEGHRVVGVQQSFTGDSRASAMSLEEMARDYVRALKQHQPEGSFCIAGHSYGSRLAFEVACQLQESGRTVANLSIFDGWPLPRSRATPSEALRAVPAFMMNLPRWVRDDLFSGRATRLGERFARKVRARLKGPEQLDLADHFDTKDLSATVVDRREQNLRSWAHYRPGLLSGNLHLFRARTRPLCHSLLDPSAGWRPFVSGEVHVHLVRGHHTNMIRGSNGQALARAMLTQINRG
ncbi:hypothetical protein CMO84_09330 [Candidatus Woesearchaeota archaeon]|jgi:thioesterase domain-containing protein/acyl carrier protein|nr:hypothetical protein [Candidatus Woesearchaeota archaeon]MDP6741055.1 alpha/beta fold hydrolase [Planctomycetota bacterium]MDP6937540.1 alpha/beta fold hydrolase [Planctomycetota bacterium]